MEDDKSKKGTLSLNKANNIKKRNPVIMSRQTHVKHNPSTHATPYKPKTNPLARQIENFQQSSIGKELGYSNSELEAVIKANPEAAKELFIKMKEDERYGGAELRSLGGGDSVYVNRESENIVSYHNLGAQSNPLDIMAGRMSGKDVTGLHSFLGHAERAREIMSSGVSMNPLSEDPAEVIAYGAREKGIDLGGLASRLKSSEAYKFSDVREIKGARNSTQALTVFKAMTGEDRSQQQVDKADLITPQLYKDASSDRFIQDAVKVTSAFNRITDYYINPLELSKDSGLKENNDLESTRRRVQNYLERELPPQVTNQAIHLAQSGKGAWADALPHPDVVAAHLGKSKFGSKYTPYLRTSAVVNELSSYGVSPDEILKASDFKEELKIIQRAFRASNEGGLKHTFDPDMRSNVHELDAMSRLVDDHASMYEVGSTQSNYIDPITGVRSEEFEDYIRSDSSEVLSGIYDSLGIQRDTSDYREGSSIPPTSKAEKAAVRDMLSRLEEDGRLDLSVVENTTTKKERDGFLAATTKGPSSVASSIGLTNPIAPTSQGPLPWPSLKPPNYNPQDSSAKTLSGTYSSGGEKFIDLRTAKEYIQGTPKDIEANRRKQEAFFNANPNLSFLSNDDDKHEAGSIWHQKRQGLLSSSAVPSLTNPKKSDALIKGLFKDAMKTDKEKFFKPDPTDFNINFSAGDALEEQGIGWYKANVDDSIFEPGMLKSRDAAKRGQSTTPDAMTEDGKKVVEFKSAQYLSDPYADPSTQEGRNQRLQWQSYYSQLQHQMYMTGAESGDIVQMMKDPLNPHLPDGGKFTSDNIQRKTYGRDDDYIKRMSPVWEKLGQSADSLSGLDTSVQKNLAKAVSEGNIDSFEKLSKKHGIDADGGIRDAIFGSDPKRRGGGSGGGGGDGGGVWGGLAGVHSPGTKGILRGLASMNPVGRFVNVVAGIAEAGYDTAIDLNDKSLDLAAQSRAAGYSDEEMFVKTRDAMGRGRYLSQADSLNDISVLTDASGGLQSGHTSSAVNIVTATRGAVTMEDIYNLDPTDANSVNNLIETSSQKLRDAGHSDFAIQAMMKRANLRSGLSVTSSTSEGRESFNSGVITMTTAVETLRSQTVSAIGNTGGDIVNEINKIFKFISSADSPFREGDTPLYQDNMSGSSKVVKEGDPNTISTSLPNSAMDPSQRNSGRIDFSKIGRKLKWTPLRLRGLSEEEIQASMNRPATQSLGSPIGEDDYKALRSLGDMESQALIMQTDDSIRNMSEEQRQATYRAGYAMREKHSEVKVALTVQVLPSGMIELTARGPDNEILSTTKVAR